jgi:RecA-family ATPase
MPESKPTEVAAGTTQSATAEIDALRACLQALSPEALAEGMSQRQQAREAELAKRLEPYKTPVTEHTMRRSSGS